MWLLARLGQQDDFGRVEESQARFTRQIEQLTSEQARQVWMSGEQRLSVGGVEADDEASGGLADGGGVFKGAR
jgi:hypothetical protein